MREGFNPGRTPDFLGEPIVRKDALITLDDLLADNRSQEAQMRMGRWYVNYRSGKLTFVWMCSDARVVNPSPKDTLVVNTFAATEDPHTYERMIAEAPFQNVAVIGHYDGKRLVEELQPKGCGALDEKSKLINGEVEIKKGVYKRVDRELQSDDVVIQVSHSARHIAEHTTKPVIALVQDHRTGQNNVVGIFYSEGDAITTSTPRLIAGLQNQEIDPNLVYAHGIPTINKRGIPFGFYGLLDSADTRQLELARNPAFYTDQGIQNPQTVVLTTDPQPIENRYPHLFGEPNSAFQLLVPRTTTSSNARVNLSGLRLAADHAEYPLTHTVKNFGKGGAFADTRTLFVETKNIDVSKQLAQILMARPFVQNFLSLSSDHQIIIGQARQGKLTQVSRVA